jgi:AhpC/TSA family protein
LPSINALHDELGSQGLKILLVDISEPRERVAEAVASRGYRAQVLLDPDGRTADAYRVRGTPTSYLIGRDGLLLGGAVGPRPWAQAQGRALLQALLNHGMNSAR